MKFVFLLATASALLACHTRPAESGSSIGKTADYRPGAGRGRNVSLVGEWRYRDQLQSCQYVFNRDGTFSGEVIYGGAKVSEPKGKWAVRGDQLFYDYSGDILGNIPPGTKDSDKLLAVTESYFVIEVRDGSKRRYERVK